VDLRTFIEERRPSWKRLEQLLQQAEMSGFKLTPAEAQELGALYRRASADLCRAQARTANAELLRYLNALVARAYGLIYSGRKFRGADVVRFFTLEFPMLALARWRPIALSTALVLLGALFGALAATYDEDARHFLLPDQYREVCEHLEEAVQAHQGRSLPPGQAAAVSSGIMWNNIGVCFTAFAMGVTLGFGTGLILFQNGVLVGVLGSAFFRAGYGTHFLALILPHGVIELTAIFIAGGAGLVIGSGLLMPGDLPRREALRRKGLEAVKLVVGCVPMLMVAGVIEGFVTPQSAIPNAAKIAFGALTGVGLIFYFAPPGTLRRIVGR
jgi:uncharacterized membrane protein SpoIIM required for sporulation